MKLIALKVTVILLLGISFSGMAQTKQIKLEANPQADKVENVKIERIDNQDVLRVVGPTDTIRIVLSVDDRSTIEKLMRSNVGKGANQRYRRDRGSHPPGFPEYEAWDVL